MNLFSRALLSIVFLGFLFVSQAQSLKLAGKVLNDKNEPLASVSVKIVGGGGTTTDIEGRFILSLAPGKKYDLEFSAIGYASRTINEVDVTAGLVNELNVTLEVKAATGDNVVITARTTSARRETVSAGISFQKNTNTVASVITAESIRRSPDKNTGEVLKRTPGASIQEGRFIIVRGLADRYNQAMLNGILLTSTEPDRKTFSFDLIPASMIDNLVINKAFVPEYPGEWAGGMIQVNTKDIPAKGFFNVQIGTGFNTQTTGKKFYKDAQGGGLDWLGTDDGTRALPDTYSTKSGFDALTPAERTTMGMKLRSNWEPASMNARLNLSIQANAGFTTKLFGKNLGGVFGFMYNNTLRNLALLNRANVVDENTQVISIVSGYNDNKYQQDVSAGALGSVSLQLSPLHKITLRSIININSHNSVTQRSGDDFSRGEHLRGSEVTFKQNTFFTTQINGDHSLIKTIRLKWYGAFTILDGYIPDQRRILYSKTAGTTDPYRLVISNTLSQQSGSRIYQNLSDYIYTAGGDLSYTFSLLGEKQTLKGGYMLQVKDRLYDAKLFANYLPIDNDALRLLGPAQVFMPTNFGDGSPGSNKLAFDAIKGNTFRYLANTILNAGFIQFDNQINSALRLVWGARIEHYDQLVGSVKTSDPRHTYSVVTDLLPGLNFTWKLNPKTNLRVSGSKTVIRPELRELAYLNLYDFELNASVQGTPTLKRTQVSNIDFRYELYPSTGEIFTAAVFYKDFNNAIEQVFNGVGGGASTFSYANAREASSYGIELEFRKKLDFIKGLKQFTFQGNASWIKSIVKDEILHVDRSLQGQSPYVLNLGLLYDHEKSGCNATLLFNQVGERIYLVGDAFAGAPDIYEAPRAQVDLQLARKSLDKKMELKLGVADLLNRTQYFYQNANKRKTFQRKVDAYRFTRSYGTSINLSLNYSF